MTCRVTSFGWTPGPSAPPISMRRTPRGSTLRHCEASTSRTWLVPMPKARVPNAPWVAVWESPQATVMPGWTIPSSGPMTCTMPWRPEAKSKNLTLWRFALTSRAAIIASACSSA